MIAAPNRRWRERGNRLRRRAPLPPFSPRQPRTKRNLPLDHCLFGPIDLSRPRRRDPPWLCCGLARSDGPCSSSPSEASSAATYPTAATSTETTSSATGGLSAAAAPGPPIPPRPRPQRHHPSCLRGHVHGGDGLRGCRVASSAATDPAPCYNPLHALAVSCAATSPTALSRAPWVSCTTTLRGRRSPQQSRGLVAAVDPAPPRPPRPCPQRHPPLSTEATSSAAFPWPRLSRGLVC